MVLVPSRGGYCPKDRRQAELLVQLHREMEVEYCRLVTISTDNITEVPALLGYHDAGSEGRLEGRSQRTLLSLWQILCSGLGRARLKPWIRRAGKGRMVNKSMGVRNLISNNRAGTILYSRTTSFGSANDLASSLPVQRLPTTTRSASVIEIGISPIGTSIPWAEQTAEVQPQ
jgi:hypothetical protein